MRNGAVSNIMLSVQHPHWLVGAATLLVAIHVFGSYQLDLIVTAMLAFASLSGLRL